MNKMHCCLKRQERSVARLYRGVPLLLLMVSLAASANRARAQRFVVSADHVSGIYQPGEAVHWRVQWEGTAPAPASCHYVLKKGGLTVLKEDTLSLQNGTGSVEAQFSEPQALLLEVKAKTAEGREIRGVGGAIAGWNQIPSSAPRPKDFDAFWKAKLKELKAVPANPQLEAADSGKPGVNYWKITLDNIHGTHIQGQIARPANGAKFPALLIVQWAGVYGLPKSWVTDRAAEGWLTLDIEAHDLPIDRPETFYQQQAAGPLQNYPAIGNDSRDTSYFLRVYLGDYRAAQYLAERPDWDGRTLVVMGGSQGGQQTLITAALHPKITAALAEVPAGCDMLAPDVGRAPGWPMWYWQTKDKDPQKVHEASRYFDAVNFASRIKCPILVGAGLIDEVCPPAGVAAAMNQIHAPKEMLFFPQGGHQDENHSHGAYTKRCWEDWLPALRQGKPAPVPTQTAQALLGTTTALMTFLLPGISYGQNGPLPSGYDDHQNMMEQLGIKAIRPGPDPNNQSTFDEAKANPYKDSLPDVLRKKDGTKVTQAKQWPKRRAEILEDFEREVYGRIPKHVPKVTWEVTATTPGESGGISTLTKTLVGHVDNSAYPQIAVNIQASFTVPANAARPVPIMIEFYFGFGRPGFVPAWKALAISKGWGYGQITPTSIQPDNNQLRSGIIGLTNKGQPRKPDDWGALRAWQWGASRLIDYFEQNRDSMVDARKVGIEGLSRYGKAAIVTEAFDPRIAVGLIGSSGEGGVKLHRHLFGEAVENLAGGEYYWMAGNFIKYGSSDPPRTAADLPVDSHELVALCAPRPCFISYGTVEHGDAKWVDAHGSFMAAVLAGPVYRLLGKKDLGTPGDYLTDPMPPVKTLIGGELAWRQHEGGHDVTPNWPAFFEWVQQYIKAPALPAEKSPENP